MKLYKELTQNSKPEHWREGAAWLAWSLIGGLLPVWLTILVLILTKQHVQVRLFTDNGEFALYSASYVAGTLYILFRDFQKSERGPFPSRSFLGLIFSVLLVAAAAIFMVVCLFTVIATGDWSELVALLDRDALRVITLTIFPIAMFLSFLIVVADNVRMMPDVKKIVGRQFKQLEDEFEELQ